MPSALPKPDDSSRAEVVGRRVPGFMGNGHHAKWLQAPWKGQKPWVVRYPYWRVPCLNV